MGERKRREERAFLTEVVAIIKVVDRRIAVVEERPLHALQTEYFRMKVEVLLDIADSHRDVVVSRQTGSW